MPYTATVEQTVKEKWVETLEVSGAFTMLDGDAQDVKCSEDQVWEPIGEQYEFSVPEARYSELKVDESSL